MKGSATLSERFEVVTVMAAATITAAMRHYDEATLTAISGLT